MAKEINRLATQIAELKDASVFEARDIAHAAVSTAQRILLDHDQRLERLEKQFTRAEMLK